MTRWTATVIGRPGLSSIAMLCVALAVVAHFASGLMGLALYPYDWDPSEGQLIDAALRVLADLSTLYPGTAADPAPWFYFPLPPLVFAVPAAIAGSSMVAARLLSTAICGAVLVLVGALATRHVDMPRAQRLGMALLAVAFAVVVEERAFWLALVRVDGLMLLCLLLAAWLVLPSELRAGADRLTVAQAAGGAVCLVAACLVKPTAVLHGAPFVLAWWWVDRRSFLRLTVFTVAIGVLSLALCAAVWGSNLFLSLSWLSDHPSFWGKGPHALLACAQRFGALVLVVLVVVWWRRRQGLPAARDSSWLLILGGATSFVLIQKHGAMWNYLLLFHIGWCVLAVRALCRAPQLVSVVLALLVLVQGSFFAQFPQPTDADAATAEFLDDVVLSRGGPLLTTKMDHLHPLIDEPLAVEGDSFVWLWERDAPRTRAVFERINSRSFSTILLRSYLWPSSAQVGGVLEDNYQPVLRCVVGLWFGQDSYTIFTPHDDPLVIPPALPATRCVPLLDASLRVDGSVR